MTVRQSSAGFFNQEPCEDPCMLLLWEPHIGRMALFAGRHMDEAFRDQTGSVKWSRGHQIKGVMYRGVP